MKIIFGLFLLCIFAVAGVGQIVEPATVYFYRVKEVAGLSNKNVKVQINKQLVFQMPQSHFLGVKLKAGKYELKMEKNQSEILLEIESGKTYFVRVSQTVAGYFYNESLTEMPEKQAIFQISKLSVLDDKKVKAKGFEFVKQIP